MSWKDVCARRLAHHSLSTPAAPGDLAGVVGAICGAHAQVMPAAEVSIGLRVTGLTQVDVREALWTRRELVKTFGPRGTVHLLPARDLPLWTAALSAVPAQPGGLPAPARLTPQQLDEVVGAIAAALDGTDELTVDELGEYVIGAAGPWAGDLVVPGFSGMWPRWRPALSTAAHRGVLCFGPNRGRRTTYTSPRRWLPRSETVAGDGRDALAEVVRRYLHAYGPATAEQFAQWLGAPRAWAVDLFGSVHLRPVEVDGSAAWVAGDDTDIGEREPPCGVRLLPYFDAYAVGCHPRGSVFPDRAALRALARGQAGPVPVMLVDGVVAGVWHQRRVGRRIEVQVESFGRLNAGRRAELDDQVGRLGEILAATPVLSLGVVNAGKHL